MNPRGCHITCVPVMSTHGIVWPAPGWGWGWVSVQHQVATGEEVSLLRGHHGPVHCARYSPAGETLASGYVMHVRCGTGLTLTLTRHTQTHTLHAYRLLVSVITTCRPVVSALHRVRASLRHRAGDSTIRLWPNKG